MQLEPGKGKCTQPAGDNDHHQYDDDHEDCDHCDHDLGDRSDIDHHDPDFSLRKYLFLFLVITLQLEKNCNQETLGWGLFFSLQIKKLDFTQKYELKIRKHPIDLFHLPLCFGLFLPTTKKTDAAQI